MLEESVLIRLPIERTKAGVRIRHTHTHTLIQLINWPLVRLQLEKKQQSDYSQQCDQEYWGTEEYLKTWSKTWKPKCENVATDMQKDVKSDRQSEPCVNYKSYKTFRLHLYTKSVIFSLSLTTTNPIIGLTAHTNVQPNKQAGENANVHLLSGPSWLKYSEGMPDFSLMLTIKTLFENFPTKRKLAFCNVFNTSHWEKFECWTKCKELDCCTVICSNETYKSNRKVVQDLSKLL